MWVGAALVGPVSAGEGAASSSRVRVVTDPLTGVALDGMDPVSYFCEPAPVQGSPDFEYVWSGVPFYFANAANRDAFIRAPEVYAPLFGGHDAMSLARGFLSDGNPNLFVLKGDRLILFYSTGNRDAFLLSEDKALEKAGANWPALSKSLPASGDPQTSLIAW